MRIAFTGDILSYPAQNAKLYQKYGKYDYSSVLTPIKKLFSECDYVVGSLETPVSSCHDYSRNCIVFNTPESVLQTLKDIGVNLLTTANNHCLDRGIRGLVKTIDAIRKHGMEYTGTRKRRTDKNYFVIEISGKLIAFVSYTYDTNADANKVFLPKRKEWLVNLTKQQYRPPVVKMSCYNRAKRGLKKVISLFRKTHSNSESFEVYPGSIEDCVSPDHITNPNDRLYVENMKETIHNAKKEADIVFFLLHSGGQFNSTVGAYTSYLIDEGIEAGADYVICNHTHTILPVAKKGNVIVSYSLGNFMFTPNDGYYVSGVYADYSIILYLTIEDQQGAMVSFSIVKNVVCADGISRVYPVYELYQHNGSQQEIWDDVRIVLKRVGYNGIMEVKEEYELA